ncbi:MAG: hypothetical protein HY725_09835, partial [Candidatus Rokubacteria bacterium]|nr:hypothetical protein [Candidatus Rokubacteria bacterium]
MTRTSKRNVAIVTLTLAGLLVSGVVMARAHMPRPGGHFWGILSRLDLTDAQKEQVKAILKEEQPRLEPLADE